MPPGRLYKIQRQKEKKYMVIPSLRPLMWNRNTGISGIDEEDIGKGPMSIGFPQVGLPWACGQEFGV